MPRKAVEPQAELVIRIAVPTDPKKTDPIDAAAKLLAFDEHLKLVDYDGKKTKLISADWA